MWHAFTVVRSMSGLKELDISRETLHQCPLFIFRKQINCTNELKSSMDLAFECFRKLLPTFRQSHSKIG